MLLRSTNLTAWEWYEPLRMNQFVTEVFCETSGATAPTVGWASVRARTISIGQRCPRPNGCSPSFYSRTGPGRIGRSAGRRHSASIHSIDPDGSSALSMQRIGGVLSLYVNRVLVGEVESGRFPTGQVGIDGSTYDHGSVDICLDDLRVWELE